MAKVDDLTGIRFGRLTVIKRAPNNKGGKTMWECVCDCGKIRIVCASNLKRGVSTSCGCFRKELLSEKQTIHGDSNNARLYRIWKNMKSRCSCKSVSQYKDYGGRGISVCEEWKHNYTVFKQWSIANGYRDDLTIDRINNDGDYCPENCRWVSRSEQNLNKRNRCLLTYRNKTQTITEWSMELGIPIETLRDRIFRYKWSVERAFETKVKTYHRKAKNDCKRTDPHDQKRL